MDKLKRIYTNELSGTPAAIDRREGIIYINPTLFNQLTYFEKRFVILHEEGHYYLNTSDEVAADAYAFDRLAGTEFKSLKKTLGTLDKLLVKGNIQRAERIYQLYKRALKWDGDNGNEDAAKEYERIKNENSLNAVTTSYSLFGLKLWTKSDPAGDAQAKANTEYTLAQMRDLMASTDMLINSVNQMNLNRLKSQKTNNQLIIIAVVALVLIVFIWN